MKHAAAYLNVSSVDISRLHRIILLADDCTHSHTVEPRHYTIAQKLWCVCGGIITAGEKAHQSDDGVTHPTCRCGGARSIEVLLYARCRACFSAVLPPCRLLRSARCHIYVRMSIRIRPLSALIHHQSCVIQTGYLSASLRCFSAEHFRNHSYGRSSGSARV